MNRPNDRLLRLCLRANAAFSATCGTALLAAPAALAGALGVSPPGLIGGLGAQLLLFAGLLVLLASRPSIRPALAMAVVVADLLWVAGIVCGAAVLALGAFCENNREVLLQRMRAMSAVLDTWN